MVTHKILSEGDIEFVHVRSLEILEKTGVRLDSEKTLKMLADKGCDVDFEQQVVRFPPALVEQALREAPKEFLLGGFDSEHNIHLGVGNTYGCSDGQGCFTKDLETGERRESTMQDVIDCSKVIDELGYIGCNWPMVTASDVPDSTRTIREMVEIYRVSSKHVQTDCYNEEQARCYIEVLDELFGRGRVVAESPLSLICCPITPLIFEGPMVEGDIAMGEINAPVVVFPMPITGMTCPMSLFSAVIQNNAEVLAGLTIFELAHPGRRVVYAACVCDMDMQTNACLEGSVEGLLANAACIQMAKHYQLPSMGAMGCDAHEPGVRSAMERAFTCSTYFAMGADLICGTGETDSSMCLCYDELVFDEDIMNLSRRLAEGVRGGEENALTDDVYEQGIGGNFLMAESTLTYLRNGEHYVPKNYRRDSYESWKSEGRPDPLAIAEGRARKILADHAVYNIDDVLLGDLYEIIERYDAEMGEE